MVTMTAPIQQTLALANQALRAGDPDGADRALAPLLARPPAHPKVLHVAGLVRMHQQRFEEAAQFFAQSREADPREAILAFSHGTALRWLERQREAAAAFMDAAALKPDYAEAYFEAAGALQQLGEMEEAESLLRQWLTVLPDHARGLMALTDFLLAAKRPAEAEPLLRRALKQILPQQMRGAFLQSLGLALYRQNRELEALEQYEEASKISSDPTADVIRAEILQRLKRYDEAAGLSASLVAREPANPQWHQFHNGLMYRLESDDYLKSFDRAPKTVELLLTKAYFLSSQKRAEETYRTYSEALALDPDNKLAALGLGSSLSMLGRHGEALTALEDLLAHHQDDCNILTSAAETALTSGDPEKALAYCQKSLSLQPHDQVALAVLGTAWRMMGDARDEDLNGYDSLIQIYDLDPPEGFCDMESFNAELNAWLTSAHPTTREYLDQSLRNGSQTQDKLFGAGP